MAEEPSGKLHSDDPSVLESIAQLKRLRAGKKGSITKRVNDLNRLVSEGGSRTKIKYLHDALLSVHLAVQDTCKELAALTPPQALDIEWLEKVNYAVESCSAEVLDYLDARKDEPASSAPSMTSSWVETHRAGKGKDLPESVAEAEELRQDIAEFEHLTNVSQVPNRDQDQVTGLEHLMESWKMNQHLPATSTHGAVADASVDIPAFGRTPSAWNLRQQLPQHSVQPASTVSDSGQGFATGPQYSSWRNSAVSNYDSLSSKVPRFQYSSYQNKPILHPSRFIPPSGTLGYTSSGFGASTNRPSSGPANSIHFTHPSFSTAAFHSSAVPSSVNLPKTVFTSGGGSPLFQVLERIHPLLLLMRWIHGSISLMKTCELGFQRSLKLELLQTLWCHGLYSRASPGQRSQPSAVHLWTGSLSLLSSMH